MSAQEHVLQMINEAQLVLDDVFTLIDEKYHIVNETAELEMENVLAKIEHLNYTLNHRAALHDLGKIK